VGVEIRDGPILIDRNVFLKFIPNAERNAYAIGFSPSNSGQNSPLNTVGNNSFDSSVTGILLSFGLLAFCTQCWAVGGQK